MIEEIDRLISFYAAAQEQAEKMTRVYQRRGRRDDVHGVRRCMLRASCFSVFATDLRNLRKLAAQHHPVLSGDALQKRLKEIGALDVD